MDRTGYRPADGVTTNVFKGLATVGLAGGAGGSVEVVSTEEPTALLINFGEFYFILVSFILFYFVNFIVRNNIFGVIYFKPNISKF